MSWLAAKVHWLPRPYKAWTCSAITQKALPEACCPGDTWFCDAGAVRGWWQCWVPSVCCVTLGQGEKPLNLSLAFGPHECLLDKGLNQRVNESPLVTQLLTGLGRERAVGEGTRAWVSS